VKLGLALALATSAPLITGALVAFAADDTTAAPAAQTTPQTTPQAPPAPTAIPALEIPARAERATAELYQQRAALRPDPVVDRVVAELPAMRASLEQLSSETLLADGVTSRELDDVVRQWRQSNDRLADWARLVTRRSQVVEAGIARVRAMDEVWQATEESAESEALPAVVMEQIAALRRILRDVRTSLQGQRDTLLATASEIGALQTMVVDRLAQAETTAARLRQELLTRDAPSLWTALHTGGPAEARALAWGRTVRQLADFVSDARGRLAAYLVVAVLLFALAVGIRGRLPSSPREVNPAVLTLASRPCRRPSSSRRCWRSSRAATILAVSGSAGLCLLVPVWRVLGLASATGSRP
jgi:hypothetical protein